MRRTLLTLLLLATALASALLIGSPASAITNGTLDGNGHPNVGGLVSPTQYSRRHVDLLLRHAHLTDRLPHRRSLRDGRRAGACHLRPRLRGGRQGLQRNLPRRPAYPGNQSDAHDIAVVVLDKAVKGITPALLPEAGSLSDLSRTQRFTSVGYGAYEVTNGPGGHRYLYDDRRMVATGTLNAINRTWLRISMNPSTGDGGTCYGDSGGPNFLGDTNIIAAITITGDAVCRATNVDYRLDTASARAFLAEYVALP